MLIFNDKFTWKGPEVDKDNLWLNSCHLWIIDLASTDNSSVVYLKPVIIVAMDLNTGPKRKICAETLGKQIFSDFNLDIKRTSWVEYDPDTKSKFMEAFFTPKYHDGLEMIYSIQWRMVSEHKRQVISKYIPEIF